MHRYRWAAALVLPAFMVGGSAGADDRPKTVAVLLDCRTLKEDAARLRCYDQAAAGLAAARQSGELVTLDGSKVAAVKKQKFGMPSTRVRVSPSLEVREMAELRQIDSTIVAIRLTSYNRYLLSLANGGRWETAEPLSYPPAVKSTISIARGAFGAFRATAGKGHSFLVKRVG